jgi:hypothetical protein
MKLSYLLLSALTLALAACATPTPYQAADKGEGYYDQKIESNRYRLHFAGNSSTPRQTVENYLLYRAAELTVANGYDYFITAEKSTQEDTRYEQTFGGGFGYYWFPHAAFGISTAYPISAFDAQADIVMFKGKKPDNDPKAFDAHEVKDNLEATIVRPKPKDSGEAQTQGQPQGQPAQSKP